MHDPVKRIGITLLGAVLCSGLAYPLGTAAAPRVDSESETKLAQASDTDQSLAVGERVEALSAQGWEPAVVISITGTDARVRYEKAELGEEAIDLRLLRRPAAAGGGKGEPPPDVTVDKGNRQPPSVTTGTGTMNPPSVEKGVYTCTLQGPPISDPAGGDETLGISLFMEIEILSDSTYRDISDAIESYSYDPHTGEFTWKSGLLAEDKIAGHYRHAEGQVSEILVSLDGKPLTCKREEP